MNFTSAIWNTGNSQHQTQTQATLKIQRTYKTIYLGAICIGLGTRSTDPGTQDLWLR